MLAAGIALALLSSPLPPPFPFPLVELQETKVHPAKTVAAIRLMLRKFRRFILPPPPGLGVCSFKPSS
jgi:hypothetical protein